MNIYYDFKEGTAATNDLPDRYEDLPKHDIGVFQAECIQNIYVFPEFLKNIVTPDIFVTVMVNNS